MRMTGGKAFVGKTTRAYPADEVIEIDHPDYREAQVAGWVSIPDVPLIKKGASTADLIAIADEADGHVLAAHKNGAVFWVPAAEFAAPQEPADVSGSGAL